MPNVQVIVERPAGEGGVPPAWRDAFYLPLEDWNGLSAAEQAQWTDGTHPQVDQRYEDWLAQVTPEAPAEPVAEPTADARAAEAADLAQQAGELASRAQQIADSLSTDAAAADGGG